MPYIFLYFIACNLHNVQKIINLITDVPQRSSPLVLHKLSCPSRKEFKILMVNCQLSETGVFELH